MKVTPTVSTRSRLAFERLATAGRGEPVARVIRRAAGRKRGPGRRILYVGLAVCV